jgi:D-glycero-D-manno-heptose 1,7-bisphosphate phosphatase
MTTPAIFLDRDGVLIENRPNYVRSWGDVELFPQAVEAVAAVSHWPYKIIIVTNQSAIGRGLVSLETVEAINQRLVELVAAANGRIDAVFTCPHAPQENCACRKPRPGLLLQAAAQHDLDLSQSIMIGDALTDLLAGRRAGVKLSALVRTGRGNEQLQLPEARPLQPIPTFADLSAALQAVGQMDIIGNKNKPQINADFAD